MTGECFTAVSYESAARRRNGTPRGRIAACIRCLSPPVSRVTCDRKISRMLQTNEISRSSTMTGDAAKA